MGHYVVIFGGAVSGAEAAARFAAQGIRVAVFDQNALPYGKLEDGLPKWHAKLRDKEEQKINEKLSHPLISYVPCTILGRNIDFTDIVNNRGFSAVVLATGAWNDRPLPVEGIDQFVGRGFYYQNPFINWFNHSHEPGCNIPAPEIHDNTIVVGGGLASLDVAKALMIETVRRALAEKGHKAGVLSLDKGIGRVLETLGLTPEGLGLKGCTLFYRRRIADMPLAPSYGDTPDALKKTEQVRKKILGNFMEKFLFGMQECAVPVDKIVENGRLAGLVFRKTQLLNGKVQQVPGSDYEVRSPLVISSIGSIPAPLPGIPFTRETFQITDKQLCRIEGFEQVFAVGNAVTGRGNINESQKHAAEISDRIISKYLAHKTPPPEETVGKISAFIRDLQQKSGYDGNYRAWIGKHLPVRIEQLEREHG